MESPTEQPLRQPQRPDERSTHESPVTTIQLLTCGLVSNYAGGVREYRCQKVGSIALLRIAYRNDQETIIL